MSDDLKEQIDHLKNLQEGSSGQIIHPKDALIFDRKRIKFIENQLTSQMNGDFVSSISLIKEKDRESALDFEANGNLYSIKGEIPSGEVVDLVFTLSEYKKMRKRAKKLKFSNR